MNNSLDYLNSFQTPNISSTNLSYNEKPTKHLNV